MTNCGACAAAPLCAFCRASHTCVPATGGQAICATGADDLPAWSTDSSTCCATGWSGAACDVCAPGYYGPSCTACDCAAGGVCNDGLTGNGSCACLTGFAGARCDQCQPQYYNTTCTQCSCSGLSYCDDGVTGVGCVCNPGFYSAACTACSCVGAEICADGIAGDGACSCAVGFAGAGCNACTAGRYGPSCLLCHCPSGTQCDQGIGNSGYCYCTEPGCEADASVSVLSVLVGTTTPDASPQLTSPATILTMNPSFDPALSAAPADFVVEVPFDVESVDLALAPEQWNTRIEVAALRPGEAAPVTQCVFDMLHNATVQPGSEEASQINSTVVALQRQCTDGPGLAPQSCQTVAAAAYIPTRPLLRVCRVAVGVDGDNNLTVTTTSSDRSVSLTYRLVVRRPLSIDCSLHALNLSVPSDCSVSLASGTACAVGAPCAVPAGCTAASTLHAVRPVFDATTSQYSAALADSENALVISSSTAHGHRCTGRYGYAATTETGYFYSCVWPTSMAMSFTTPEHSTLGSTAEQDHLVRMVAPPLGWSLATLVVESESGPACTYKINVSRGLSNSSELHALYATLGGLDGVEFSRSLNLSEASAAAVPGQPTTYGGTVSLQVQNWVTTVSFSASISDNASYTVDCPACSNLAVGETVATLTVIAEDTVHMRVVEVVLFRQPSSVCRLSQLQFLLVCASCTSAYFFGGVSAGDTGVTLEHRYVQVPENNIIYAQLRIKKLSQESDAAVDETKGAWSYPLLNDELSEKLPLVVGKTNMTINSTAEDGTVCEYDLTFTRPVSSDTSILTPSAQPLLGLSLADLGRTIFPTTLLPCSTQSCYSFLLQPTEIHALLNVTATHASFCATTPPFACSSPTTLAFTSLTVAPLPLVVDPVGSAGSGGIRSAHVQIPPGESLLLVTVTAEDSSQGNHTIAFQRQASSDATLGYLILGDPSQATIVTSTLQSRAFLVELSAGQRVLTLIGKASSSQAALTINGTVSPATFSLTSSSSVLTLQIIAEDGTTQLEYAIKVQCAACGAPSPPTTDIQEVDQAIHTVSPIWLTLVLLSTAMLLCTLSLGVCARVHWLRLRRRQAMQVMAGTAATGVPPEVVLAHLQPFLMELAGKCDDDFVGDACAICLADVAVNERLTVYAPAAPIRTSATRAELA